MKQSQHIKTNYLTKHRRVLSSCLYFDSGKYKHAQELGCRGSDNKKNAKKGKIAQEVTAENRVKQPEEGKVPVSGVTGAQSGQWLRRY